MRFRTLMQDHHYLGALPKIGETLWYVATYGGEWVALLIFSAAAWKCAVRDRWIGWSYRHQYDRLKLLANNSRFLILPDWHYPNLASRTLAVCLARLSTDWQAQFGHPLLMVETFVDPSRFHGTIYQASNWNYLGQTRGFRRIQGGYSTQAASPKKVFIKPLQADARAILALSAPLNPLYRSGAPKLMLTANQTGSLYDYFIPIPDPRSPHGRRHALPTVLAIATAAVLCGMRGYKAISDWANRLGPKARERFLCRRVNGIYQVPSEYVIRDCLIRVNADQLDLALQRWNAARGLQDETLSIDGKTMKNAVDEQGQQTHIMSVIGHTSKNCYTQKKLALCP